jgi:hypothetical protein
VSALGVAQRTPKECKDKWGNTNKEAKQVYSLARKEQRQTGGGPEIKLVTPAINRTIDLSGIQLPLYLSCNFKS